jgi:hypothetical protein
VLLPLLPLFLSGHVTSQPDLLPGKPKKKSAEFLMSRRQKTKTEENYGRVTRRRRRMQITISARLVVVGSHMAS